MTEELGLPVKGKTTDRRVTPHLGSRQIYRLLDLAVVAPSEKDRNFITVRWNNEAKTALRQKGVYIWMHPDFGIFYVGIATRDNLNQRWNSHIQKLVGRAKVQYPKRWKEFAQQFLDKGQSRADVNMLSNDLDKVRIAFYPIEIPDGVSAAEYKKGVEDLEDRIVTRWNPRAQGKYNPNLNTVTKNVYQEDLDNMLRLAGLTK